MNKVSIRIMVFGLILILMGSCSQLFNKEGTGELTIVLSGSGSRALAAAPATLPVFLSVTINIKSGETLVLSRTFDNPAASFKIAVAEGTYTVEAIAIPARIAETTTPTPEIQFAASYSGVASNVSTSDTLPALIELTLQSTVIAIPDSYNSSYSQDLAWAEGPDAQIMATASYLGIGRYSDFAFDLYGRMFMSGYNSGPAIYRYSNAGPFSAPKEGDPVYNEPIVVLPNTSEIIGGLALAQAHDGRLYYVKGEEIYIDYGEGGEWVTSWLGIRYVDMAFDEAPYSPRGITLPAEINSLLSPAIAVDASGNLYVAAEMAIGETPTAVIAKLEVDPFDDSTVLGHYQTFQFLELESVDSWFLSVQDLQVVNGKLIVLASEIIYNSVYDSAQTSRGQVLALDLATLTPVSGWHTGWSEDLTDPLLPVTMNYPWNPDVQYYGPSRVVGHAPGVLYLADEGFLWESIETDPSNFPGVFENVMSNKDRIIELNLGDGSFRILFDGITDDFSLFRDFFNEGQGV